MRLSGPTEQLHPKGVKHSRFKKNTSKIVLLFISTNLLWACAAGTDEDTEEPPIFAASCPATAHIVNLDQDPSGEGSCSAFSDRDDVAQCVTTRIQSHVQNNSSCLGKFDVFVPGTFQENGDFRQFSSLIETNPDRTYLSLKYGNNFLDAAAYNEGVDAASLSLDELLYSLKSVFNTTDIRVFGHSKGAHAVASTSLNSQHSDVDFFAFGQAGRTPANIKGGAGYIEKITNNLVTMTWQNDEVKFYTGGANGFVLPELWGWPGFINQGGGGATIAPARIDHHNNYGGSYTINDFTYCATGHKSAMLGIDDPANECVKQDGVSYLPYFWGDAECKAIAFQYMNNAQPGDKHYIGYSGPRAAQCSDTVGLVQAQYSLRYRMTPADQGDCEAVLQLDFRGLDFGTDRQNGGRIVVNSTRDTQWETVSGTVALPLHMEIGLWAYLNDVSGLFTSCRNPLSESEIYVDTLKVSFNHPKTGEPVNRTSDWAG